MVVAAVVVTVAGPAIAAFIAAISIFCVGL